MIQTLPSPPRAVAPPYSLRTLHGVSSVFADVWNDAEKMVDEKTTELPYMISQAKARKYNFEQSKEAEANAKQAMMEDPPTAFDPIVKLEETNGYAPLYSPDLVGSEATDRLEVSTEGLNAARQVAAARKWAWFASRLIVLSAHSKPMDCIACKLAGGQGGRPSMPAGLIVHHAAAARLRPTHSVDSLTARHEQEIKDVHARLELEALRSALATTSVLARSRPSQRPNSYVRSDDDGSQVAQVVAALAAESNDRTLETPAPSLGSSPFGHGTSCCGLCLPDAVVKAKGVAA